MKIIIGLSGVAALALVALPAAAQTTPATMTPDQVGAQPMTGLSDQDFVAKAADSDQYEIRSSKLALTKSKDPQVKSFAREMITDHGKTTAGLKSAVAQDGGKVHIPSPPMTADTKAKIATLRSTPAAQFDQVYLQQQMAGHQQAWALHDGYATSGADPALKQAASTALPIVEHHLQMLKSMPMANGSM